MGQRYLADSNVIIDYMAGLLPMTGGDFLEHIFNEEFLVSLIVKIEVLGFDHVPNKLDAMERFVSSGTNLTLDDAITDECILLGRSSKPSTSIFTTTEIRKSLLKKCSTKSLPLRGIREAV